MTTTTHTAIRADGTTKAHTFTGAHLFDITATTDDGQSARAVIAADDEWKARTRLMLIQTTMKLRGQLVTYTVVPVDAAAPKFRNGQKVYARSADPQRWPAPVAAKFICYTETAEFNGDCLIDVGNIRRLAFSTDLRASAADFATTNG